MWYKDGSQIDKRARKRNLALSSSFAKLQGRLSSGHGIPGSNQPSTSASAPQSPESFRGGISKPQELSPTSVEERGGGGEKDERRKLYDIESGLSNMSENAGGKPKGYSESEEIHDVPDAAPDAYSRTSAFVQTAHLQLSFPILREELLRERNNGALRSAAQDPQLVAGFCAQMETTYTSSTGFFWNLRLAAPR
ncbi:hypothetical protein K438DRAFT_1775997 [Mycena galopus ATCC 62051]|nr:hypothetical protein K438DRAFT_1775997 [Mycena galopus ATCC 62051]